MLKAKHSPPLISSELEEPCGIPYAAQYNVT